MSAYRRRLPLIPLGGWRAKAACTARVKEMLWDDRVDGETDGQRDARHAQAQAVCNHDCPVRARCSDEVNWRIDEGVRGGHLLPALNGQHTEEEEFLLSLLQKGWPLDQAVRAQERRVQAAEAI